MKTRPTEDICRSCERYAVGCDPLIMPDGSRLRQLQRDKSKRYCAFHMPAFREAARIQGKRRHAGLPPIEKVIKLCKMPLVPTRSILANEFDCREIPTVTRADTPTKYIDNVVIKPSNQSQVDHVEWYLIQPTRRFIVLGEENVNRESGVFYVCGIRGRRRSDNEHVIAVKYRTSQKADALWLWREASRVEEVEQWARGQHHVNVAVWQWGIEETLLQKE